MNGKVVSYYKLLEHLGGESLGRGPLKVEDTIDIAIQVAQGLDKFHESRLG